MVPSSAALIPSHCAVDAHALTTALDPSVNHGGSHPGNGNTHGALAAQNIGAGLAGGSTFEACNGRRTIGVLTPPKPCSPIPRIARQDAAARDANRSETGIRGRGPPSPRRGWSVGGYVSAIRLMVREMSSTDGGFCTVDELSALNLEESSNVIIVIHTG
jgi:hypothetical protein